MKAIIGIVLLLFSAGVLCADDIGFLIGSEKGPAARTFYLRRMQQLPSSRRGEALGRLVNDPRLWREFVPVAFHVDYWDRLGWKDPFASVEWTKRQQTYAENWKAETVYTPAFVLNGREWRNANVPPATEAPGVLKIGIRGDGTVAVNFEPANGISGEFEVYLARLGFGINVNVRAGENNGHIYGTILLFSR